MPLLSWWFSACAIHRVGMVDAGESGTRLRSVEQGEERLLLLGDAARLQHLDGYLVELDGTRVVGRTRVTSFRPLEGPHGMAVFCGPIQVLGVQIGIQDVSSGMLVLVDEVAEAELSSYAGKWIAAEGFVVGPQRVEVSSWVALD